VAAAGTAVIAPVAAVRISRVLISLLATHKQTSVGKNKQDLDIILTPLARIVDSVRWRLYCK
jgi:hypothetical protein